MGALPSFAADGTTMLLSSIGKKTLLQASGPIGTNSDCPSMLFVTSRFDLGACTRLDGVTGDSAPAEGPRGAFAWVPCLGTSSVLSGSIPCSRSKSLQSCINPPNLSTNCCSDSLIDLCVNGSGELPLILVGDRTRSPLPLRCVPLPLRCLRSRRGRSRSRSRSLSWSRSRSRSRL